jgi:predicted phosphoribosyltransferase
VDDGLATGATMRAAITALRQREVGRIVVAVPVGAPEVCAALAAQADEAVWLLAPDGFQAVGQYYRDFSQTSDEEVRALLARAAPPTSRSP